MLDKVRKTDTCVERRKRILYLDLASLVLFYRLFDGLILNRFRRLVVVCGVDVFDWIYNSLLYTRLGFRRPNDLDV